MASPSRGSITIFKNLFDEAPGNTIDLVPSQREKKIDCIIDYYYYHGQRKVLVNGKPVQIGFAGLLEIVGGAFFISSITVHDIIKANSVKVALVKQQWKGKDFFEMQKTFSAKWPQFVW